MKLIPYTNHKKWRPTALLGAEKLTQYHLVMVENHLLINEEK